MADALVFFDFNISFEKLFVYSAFFIFKAIFLIFKFEPKLTELIMLFISGFNSSTFGVYSISSVSRNKAQSFSLKEMLLIVESNDKSSDICIF